MRSLIAMLPESFASQASPAMKARLEAKNPVRCESTKVKVINKMKKFRKTEMSLLLINNPHLLCSPPFHPHFPLAIF